MTVPLDTSSSATRAPVDHRCGKRRKLVLARRSPNFFAIRDPVRGDERIVVRVRLEDERVAIENRRARMAPLVIGVPEPTDVPDADIFFPDEIPVDIVTGDETDRTEDGHDVLAVRERSRVGLARFRVALGLGNTAIKLALPDDGAVTDVDCEQKPPVLGEVVHRPHVTVQSGAERVVPRAAHCGHHEHTNRPR